jgi:UDP-N-acetylglucosamine acyltransferase
MSTIINPRAIVSPKAQLGENVSIGPFTIVEDEAVIGEGTHVGANVLIASGARIGKECRIHHGAVLATAPQDLKYRDEPTTLEIGDNTVIREYATLNRGTHDRWKTTVGSHCFIMAYVHVAHDCEIGDHVILANGVNMAGHVVIEEHAIIGGVTPIHQFVRIGRHSMIGGGFRVPKDVPPYVLAGQEPLVFQGLNIVGLKRRNFSSEAIGALENAYRLLYQSRLNVTQAIERIKAEIPQTEEVRYIVDFVTMSKRGIIGSRR